MLNVAFHLLFDSFGVVFIVFCGRAHGFFVLEVFFTLFLFRSLKHALHLLHISQRLSNMIRTQLINHLPLLHNRFSHLPRGIHLLCSWLYIPEAFNTPLFLHILLVGRRVPWSLNLIRRSHWLKHFGRRWGKLPLIIIELLLIEIEFFLVLGFHGLHELLVVVLGVH